MRVEDVAVRDAGGRRRISARVRWEEAAQPDRILFFETEAPFARGFEPTGDLFVTACFAMASRLGERRLRVEGSVCPRLRDGVEAVGRLFRTWDRRCGPVAVEPTRGFVPARPRASRRTGLFFSGGVDAFALLRCNTRDYPRGHAGRAADAFHLFGTNDFDYPDPAEPPGGRRAGEAVDSEADPARLAAWSSRREALRGVVEAEGLALVPVWTNVRRLCPDYRTWILFGFAPMTLAVVHAFGSRVDRALFASDERAAHTLPAASHPLVEPWLSTAAVGVEHAVGHLSRLDRLRLLCDWEPARRLLQPCHCIEIPPPGRVNCGRCEKCVRTMLALAGLGRLHDVPAFAEDDIDPRLVEAMPIDSSGKRQLLAQCVDPLRRSGRRDLARAVERRLAASNRRRRKARWRRLLPLG